MNDFNDLDTLGSESDTFHSGEDENRDDLTDASSISSYIPFTAQEKRDLKSTVRSSTFLILWHLRQRMERLSPQLFLPSTFEPAIVLLVTQLAKTYPSIRLSQKYTSRWLREGIRAHHRLLKYYPMHWHGVNSGVSLGSIYSDAKGFTPVRASAWDSQITDEKVFRKVDKTVAHRYLLLQQVLDHKALTD